MVFFTQLNHTIIESVKLEETSNIIDSNHQRITTSTNTAH